MGFYCGNGLFNEFRKMRKGSRVGLFFLAKQHPR
jgi:hypothetical protein